MSESAYRIAVLPGDGIGAEVTAEAVKVLNAVSAVFGSEFVLKNGLIGGAAMDATGEPLPQATLDLCKNSDAILLGAVGDPKYDDPHAAVRPEQALLGLRKAMGLFVNLRPVWLHPALASASPLRPDLVENVNLVVVRELTGGIYFGEPRVEGQDRAVDTMVYTRPEVERIAHVAFRSARRKVTSVDKANVLACSRLWRSAVEAVAQEYPEVELEHLLIDAATMHLIKRPADFDVILTGNMFGDILSDETSVLAGSMGMLPSASLADGPDARVGLYEPIHGSAPDIAGRNIANPLAAILSIAMMLRYSFAMEQEAQAVEAAVTSVLDAGHRTADIAIAGEEPVSTEHMGDLVVQELGR
jgi:3-isopropylmalate dehydrogenase